MKRWQLSIFYFFLVFTVTCKAQKQDYVWLSGYLSYPHPVLDTFHNTHFATSVMNFNYDPVKVSMDSLQMYFSKTNTSYCDINGRLLFYTNGCYIANSLNEKMENSDSLNDGYYRWEWDTFGYRSTQGIVALPMESSPGTYFLLHSLFDRKGLFGASHYSNILGTVIDMTDNIGFGKVASINQSIIADTVGGDLVAVQHGNGWDWWIIVQRKSTNCFYKILLDNTGFHLRPQLNCGGPEINFQDFGSSAFSPDGSKYAHFTIETGLTIFDFNRCTGELANPEYISSNIWKDSVWISSGLAFSPNSRFLYVSMTKLILQYDMWSQDIPNSVDTIGKYDGYYFSRPIFQTLFNTMQAGADGKIYISCGNGVPVYHVIDSPDLKGIACAFHQHSVDLPSPSSGVPNFPNYRLGKLIGSECDTITGLDETARAEKEKILKVFPNPASDIVTIDYGFTDWSKAGEISLEIVNNLGQVVYIQPVPQYSGFQKVDVSRYSSGLYTTYIKRNNALVSTGKFAKQ